MIQFQLPTSFRNLKGAASCYNYPAPTFRIWSSPISAFLPHSDWRSTDTHLYVLSSLPSAQLWCCLSWPVSFDKVGSFLRIGRHFFVYPFGLVLGEKWCLFPFDLVLQSLVWLPIGFTCFRWALIIRGLRLISPVNQFWICFLWWPTPSPGTFRYSFKTLIANCVSPSGSLPATVPCWSDTPCAAEPPLLQIAWFLFASLMELRLARSVLFDQCWLLHPWFQSPAAWLWWSALQSAAAENVITCLWIVPGLLLHNCHLRSLTPENSWHFLFCNCLFAVYHTPGSSSHLDIAVSTTGICCFQLLATGLDFVRLLKIALGTLYQLDSLEHSECLDCLDLGHCLRVVRHQQSAFWLVLLLHEVGSCFS